MENYHIESLLKQKHYFISYFSCETPFMILMKLIRKKMRVLLKSGVYSSLGFNTAGIECTFDSEPEALQVD